MRVAVLVLLLHGALSLAKTLQDALHYAGWICRDPEMREEFYIDGPCTCGPSCTLFGDCCQDSEYFVHEAKLGGKSLSSCVNMATGYFLMITLCPQHWEHNGTRTSCEHPDITYPNPLFDVPVTSRRTNITYRNGHCAICHQDFDPSVDDLWPFEFICGDEITKNAVVKLKYASVKTTNNCQDNSGMNDAILNLSVEELADDSFVYSFDGFHYKILNTANIIYPRSVSECITYDNSESHWYNNLTCAFYVCHRIFIENHYARELDKIVKTQRSYKSDHGATNDRDCHTDDPTGIFSCFSCERDDHIDTEDNISFGAYGTLTLTEDRDHSICFKKHLLIPIGTAKCGIKIYHPRREGIHLKRCRTDLIETCAEDWTDRYIEEKCTSYTDPWCLDEREFGNIFCAYCNYVNPLVFVMCRPRMFSGGFTTDFSLLVDWSALNSLCKKLEVYDPVKDTCININLHATGVRSAKIVSTDEVEVTPNAYITFIGLSLSMTCLILHLIIFMLTPKLRNLASMSVASLCVALLLLYASFIATSFAEPPCAELAIALHYSLLATFSWMAIISFDVWKTIRCSVNKIRVFSGLQWKRFSVYSACCWIAPVIILTPALIVEFYVPDSGLKSYYGVTNCWMQNRDALLIFVVAPLCVVMTLNVAFFSWSAYLVYKAKSAIAKTSNERKDFTLFLRMALIMGLTWSSGLIAGLVQYAGVWYVFIVLNTLQGLFIFIAFSCREKILKEVLSQRHWLSCVDASTPQFK